MLCALIMAGGRGERFWPLSTDEKPKQFLNLLGNDTMIQMTVKRLQRLIPIERVFIVTGESYVTLVKEQLPELPTKNIIVEPIGRNTAPCIALSAFHIEKLYKDATIVVLPSDHLITDEESFTEILEYGTSFVEKNNYAIVTIGIEPDRPETGYGYIRFAKEIASDKKNKIFNVESFVEKPTLEKANLYLSEGNYLWNGGMFIWKANNILELTEKHLNRTYELLKEIAATSDDDFKQVCNEKYCLVDNISVDYAIMEKANEIYVIPGNFGWDDIGNWKAVERYSNKDEHNNIYKGSAVCIKGNDNILISQSKLIVTSGIDNLLIVESDGIIFVADKNNLDNIKEIKEKINQIQKI